MLDDELYGDDHVGFSDFERIYQQIYSELFRGRTQVTSTPSFAAIATLMGNITRRT